MPLVKTPYNLSNIFFSFYIKSWCECRAVLKNCKKTISLKQFKLYV